MKKEAEQPKKEWKPVYIPSTHDKIRKTVKFYIKHKQPFTFEVQNDSIAIASRYGSYRTLNKDYKIWELNFIKSVRQYILKNQLYVPFKNKKPNPVKYFHIKESLRPGNTINDVVNIDIKSAYWETAYQLGLLSEDLYKQGNEPPVYETRTAYGKTYDMLISGTRKITRLAAIGSLARKKYIYEYDGKGRQRLKDIKRQKHTEILWDVICSHVGEVLMKIAKACGKDFIFFWVDGIYIKKSAADKVKALFKKHGYDFTVNKIKSIDVTESNIFVNLVKPEIKVIDGVEKIKTRKPFPFRETKKTK